MRQTKCAASLMDSIDYAAMPYRNINNSGNWPPNIVHLPLPRKPKVTGPNELIMAIVIVLFLALIVGILFYLVEVIQP